jgi:hypothetical protein
MTRVSAWRTLVVLALAVLGTTHAAAQVPVVVSPPNIIAPNFNGQQPGLKGSLEGGAMVARGDDASATWYNPAGLSRVETTIMSASGGAAQWLWVSPNAFPTNAGSTSHVPAQVGIAWREPFDYLNWTAALSFAAVNSWEHDLSSELQLGTATAPERFAYAASSSYTRYVGSVGAGYSPDQKLRLGGSLDIELTRLRQAQSVNDRILLSPTATSLLVASHSKADFTHLRASFGMQYDISKTLRFGAVVKTPGIRLTHSGSAGFDATLDKGGARANLSFYDPRPELQLKTPFEFVAGVAYVLDRATIEGDVRITQGSGTYDFFTTTKTLTGIVTPAGGVPKGAESAFRSYRVDSRGVVDVRFGGHYVLTPRGQVTVHGGFATANSPVGASDEVFQKVNLRRLTAGLSCQSAHFTFAGGLDYQNGTSPLYDVYVAQGGQVIKTTVNVKGFGLLYSFGLRF